MKSYENQKQEKLNRADRINDDVRKTASHNNKVTSPNNEVTSRSNNNTLPSNDLIDLETPESSPGLTPLHKQVCQL